ncbi:Remorin, C-terminal [Dillenia turbinata]|uniref:Remorin, C-terminal n=1 Tax=Dillenia turbinata TaxID=194707 RepID=A0AAN8VBU9_9MAGN
MSNSASIMSHSCPPFPLSEKVFNIPGVLLDDGGTDKANEDLLMYKILTSPLRIRFPTARQSEGPDALRGRKEQGWFSRQFSRQLSREDSSNGDEYPTALAAAAFAATSIEEDLSIADQKKMNEVSQASLPKSKSRREETKEEMPHAESGIISRWLSGESSIKERPERQVSIAEPFEEKRPEKTAGRVPSMRKSVSFDDKQLKETAKKPEIKEPEKFQPLPYPPVAQPSEPKMQVSAKRHIGESKADAWERAEMDKIRKHYKTSTSTIDSWASEKKQKAKHKIDRIQSELQRRIAKALQEYSTEIERIEEIAGGARAQAAEKRRNKELKVKEKANQYRSTGKLPSTCPCF